MRVIEGGNEAEAWASGYDGPLHCGMVMGIRTVHHIGAGETVEAVSSEHRIRLLFAHPFREDVWIYENFGTRFFGGTERKGQISTIPEANLRAICRPVED